MNVDVRAGGVAQGFDFAGEQPLDLSPEYAVKAPANVKGHCIGTADDVYVVSGTMEFGITGVCALCSKAAGAHMEVEFEERFSKEPDDEETYRYDGETLDLSQALNDNAFLARLGRILCKEDCAGLCPVCGKDLNDGDCGCETVSDNPFEVLRQLNLPEEE